MENYNIYDEIGRGTHSFVYKARRKRSIKYVAVKSTAKSRMEKILNEVPFLHKLNSRYVLKFFDWYESSNHIWLILEYCMGGGLLNLITQDKQLPESVVKSFGSDLVAGLQYLHANSILYCDLKPATILIDEFGSLKLADFGLARRIPGIEAAPTRPLAPGSPHYMAPELFQQTAVHSFASDFWALGCVLFELRTGRQPFTHSNFSDLARMIQTDAVEFSVPGCEMSIEFCNLLNRLLVKDPYDRITWNELVDHPFWKDMPRFENISMPLQELFEKERPVPLNNTFSKDGDLGHPRLQYDVNAERSLIGNGGIAVVSNTSATQDQQPQSRENKAAATSNDDVIGCLDFEALDFDEAIQVNCTQITDHDKASSAGTRIPQARNRASSSDDFDNDVFQDDYSEVSSQLAGFKMANTPHSTPPVIQHAPKQRIQRCSMFAENGVSGNWLSKVSKLVFTAADCRVKSIIGNNDVKLDTLPSVRAELLQFTLIPPKGLLSCTTETLKNQLNDIYVSLKSVHADIAEKHSCMAYLFSLSCHTPLAHVIVNSSILRLLIRMLVQEIKLSASDKTMLSMLCLVLGILFQFATVDAPSSPDQLHLLVTTLANIVANFPGTVDNMDIVCRNWLQSRSLALACLGELLNYILTQQEWEVPVEGVDIVLACIEDRDIVTRYYAVRTLHNMLVHCPELLLPKLLSKKVVLTITRGMKQYATSGLLEQSDLDEQRTFVALRTNTTETLAHILRHLCSPTTSAQLPSRLKLSITLHFAKPDILKAVWRGVESRQGPTDLTIASLNVINTFLDMKLGGDRKVEYTAINLSRALLLERIIGLSTIQRVLETHSSSSDGADESLAIMQAKGLVMMCLGIRLNRYFLTSFVHNDPLTHVEQILARVADHLSVNENNLVLQSSENKLPAAEMYLAQCALSMCNLVIQMTLTLFADFFSSHEGGKDEDRSNNNAEDLPRMLPLSFQLFSGLLQNPNCRQQLFNYLVASNSKQYAFFLRLMATLLTLFPDEVLTVPGDSVITMTIARFVSNILLHLFQHAVAEANEIAVVEKHILFTHLLPAVARHVYRHSESDREHVAMTCLEILHVVLLDFDYSDDNGKHESYNTFVRSILFPYVSKMLRSQDTAIEKLWSLSSDLLFRLLSSDLSFLTEAKDLDLVSTVVNLLAVPTTFTSLPIHATKLVQMLMDSVDVDLDVLVQSGIAQSIVTGLTTAAKQNEADGNLLGLVVMLLKLLHHQFEKMRQDGLASCLAGFSNLDVCGPLLLQFCARGIEHQHHGCPMISLPENDANTETMIRELANVSSRCLVLLSQVSGEQLTEAIFTTQDESNVSVLSSIFSWLQTHASNNDINAGSVIVLRMLLTIKHCLHCQGKKRLVSHWVTRNIDCLHAAEALALRKQPSQASDDYGSTDDPLNHPSILEQISKAAAAIVSLCHTSYSQ